MGERNLGEKVGEKIFVIKNLGENILGEKMFEGKNLGKFHRDRFSHLRETCNQRFGDNNYYKIY